MSNSLSAISWKSDALDQIKPIIKQISDQENIALPSVELNEKEELLESGVNNIRLKITFKNKNYDILISLNDIKENDIQKQLKAVDKTIREWTLYPSISAIKLNNFTVNNTISEVVKDIQKFVTTTTVANGYSEITAEIRGADKKLSFGNSIINYQLKSGNEILKTKVEVQNTSNTITKIKEYIDHQLHSFGNTYFDEFTALNPDRQFYTDQHYSDVVAVVNKYIKLYCKQEDFDLVKAELDEENAQLENGQNLIKIKLVLDGQLVKSKINLKNVKTADESEKKANLLAIKLVKQVHNFTYMDFTESNTVMDIVTKIKETYKQDLTAGYYDSISFDSDDNEILPSTKLKWEENIIPLVVNYNRKPTKVKLKVKLISQQQFPQYEVEQVINRFLTKEEDSFDINSNIDKVDLKSVKSYQELVDKINAFPQTKTIVKVKPAGNNQPHTPIDQSNLPIKVKLDVYYLTDYTKTIDLKID